MALTDYVTAIMPGDKAPITAILKKDKDEFKKIYKNVDFKDITEYVKSEDLLGQVQEFIENVMSYEFLGRSQKDEYVVDIYWGDWKHDHLRLDALMKDIFNMDIVNSLVTNENGDDSYCAQRFYKLAK